MSSYRPIVKLPRTSADLIVEAFNWAGLLTFVFFILEYESQVPNHVPIHFNIHGIPDRWGGRGWVLLLPFTATLISAVLHFVRRFPHKFNYPWPITQSNARRQYRTARTLISVLQAILVWSLSYLNLQIILISIGDETRLPKFYAPSLVGLMLAVLIVYYYLAKQNR